MNLLKIASEEEAARYIHNYNLLGKDNWYNRHRCENIASFLPRTATKKALLDFGCGNGMFLLYLQSQGHALSLAGYDPFMPDIDLGRKIRFYRELDAKHWGRYDYVSALDVIEHVKDDVALLLQMKKLLSSDGMLLLTVPIHQFLYSLHDAALGHYRRYHKRDLWTVLSHAGFSVEHWGHAYAFLVIPALLVKYICYIKQALGRKIHINDLPIDPLGVCSLLARLERKIIQAGRKLPVGTSVYVCARQTVRRGD